MRVTRTRSTRCSPSWSRSTGPEGTLQPGDSPYVPPAGRAHRRCGSRPRRSPLADGLVLVADAGHHRVVELAVEPAGAGGGQRVVRRRGGGFNEPNGLCLLPVSAPRSGTTSWSPTPSTTAARHRPRLRRGDGRSPATGEQWMQGDATDRLSSPWDVAWWQDRVWIAMAGIHQLWTFDPRTGAVEVAAGTTNEGLVDGPLARRGSRRPSGLAAARRPALARGLRDLLAAVRRGRAGAHRGRDRGCSTSASATARPTRRCSSTRSASPCCPTAVSRSATPTTARSAATTRPTARSPPWPPAWPSPRRRTSTVDGHAELVVVESAAHRLTRVPLGHASRTDGFSAHHPAAGDRGRRDAEPRDRRLHPAARAEGRRPVRPAVPAGRGGHASRPAAQGRGPGHRPDPHARPRPGGRRGRAARGRAGGVLRHRSGEGAACHMHQQDWGVPVRVAAGADGILGLPLGGSE